LGPCKHYQQYINPTNYYVNMNRLTSKNCIVTGAGDGIGRGIALAFANEGASVAICDINAETLKETHQHLQNKGIQIFSKAFDIIDVKAIATMVNTFLLVPIILFGFPAQSQNVETGIANPSTYLSDLKKEMTATRRLNSCIQIIMN